MTETLRELSMYPNEFHLFLNSVRPGPARERDETMFHTLTYKNTDMGNYVPTIINAELLSRITPKDGHVGTVSPAFFENVRVLHAITGVKNGYTNIKVALQNRTTKKVVLLTSHNSVPTDYKHVPAIADGWYVLNCDMVAYGGFWEGVKLSL